MPCVDNYQTGQTIVANGSFILGQEQDAFGIVVTKSGTITNTDRTVAS